VIAAVAPMIDQQYGVVNRPAAFNYVAAGLTGPKTCLKCEGTPDQFSSQDDSYCTVDRAALAAIARPCGPAEAGRSYMNGHDNGLAACNSYFPETSVAK
jgi:hypothetical protein